MRKVVKYGRGTKVTSFRWSNETREYLKSMLKRYGTYEDTYDSFLYKLLKMADRVLRMLKAKNLDDGLEKLKELELEAEEEEVTEG